MFRHRASPTGNRAATRQLHSRRVYLRRFSEQMYDWANDPNTPLGAHSLIPGLVVDPTNGRTYYDPVSGIPRVLGNNPEAANDFFTGGSSTIIHGKRALSDTPLDNHVQSQPSGKTRMAPTPSNRTRQPPKIG